ncbi:MAG: hypothetical protein LBV03_09140 [Fusobacteriales bacterium]|nr:hypothetical protein [Fusobacteriales bacterium]
MDHKKTNKQKVEEKNSTQSEVNNKNEEMSTQAKNGKVNEHSNNRKADKKGRQYNECEVVQKQKCDGEKISESKIKDIGMKSEQVVLAHTHSSDRSAETRRISTRSKKIPNRKGNEDFLW